MQCASFYVERIDLASKLRKCSPKWRWSRPFSGKSPLTNFQQLIPQITLLADFTHFERPFSLQNQKNNLFTSLKTFCTVFKIHHISHELSLSRITQLEVSLTITRLIAVSTNFSLFRRENGSHYSLRAHLCT